MRSGVHPSTSSTSSTSSGTGWGAIRPPTATRRPTHSAGAMLDAYGTAADRAIDWSATGGGIAGLGALGPALEAGQAAGDALTAFGHTLEATTMPGLTGDARPARPARDQPPDRGGPRRIARGPRRPGRRRGAARDPRGRPAPGPGRGRGHDADPGQRGRAGGRLPPDGGPARRPGGAGHERRRPGRRSASPTTRSSSACRGRSTIRRSPSAISSPPRRAASAARPRSTRSHCGPTRCRTGRSSRARSSSPCRTCCARPSAPSTRPAASTRPACSRRVASSSASARTSGATTRSTSSSARRCWPARCRSTIGS